MIPYLHHDRPPTPSDFHERFDASRVPAGALFEDPARPARVVVPKNRDSKTPPDRGEWVMRGIVVLGAAVAVWFVAGTVAVLAMRHINHQSQIAWEHMDMDDVSRCAVVSTPTPSDEPSATPRDGLGSRCCGRRFHGPWARVFSSAPGPVLSREVQP